MAYIGQVNVKGTLYDIKAKVDSAGNVINTTYLPLSGGTMTGDINMGSKNISAINKLTINNTGANAHIVFSRASYNYITAPTGGTIAFAPGGTTSGAGAKLAVDETAVFPGQNNNLINLGTSSYKWATVYATTFSGNATSASKVNNALTLGNSGKTFNGSAAQTIGNAPYYIVGSSVADSNSATAGNWTGTCDAITSLYDGLTIIFVPSVAGNGSSTARTTESVSMTYTWLKINSLGWKKCYYNNSNLTTHYAANTPILMVYKASLNSSAGGWQCIADYNANNQISVYRQNTGYTGKYPVLVSRTVATSIGTAGTNGSATGVYGVIYENSSKEYVGPTVTPSTGQLWGAVWNDYAEFRKADSIAPGYCVVEKGDDTLTLSTARMQPGAEIISDTFGFAIGETEDCKTPIAATGRVLAYTYESRDEYRNAIGRPVCSGPNGTVSLMTDEEYAAKGYCAIGFVSAVPDYEEWGTGNVKVNGRVWIRVR